MSLFLQNFIMVELKSTGFPRSSTSKIRTFKEKKEDFLAIYKENVARLLQKPKIIKTI